MLRFRKEEKDHSRRKFLRTLSAGALLLSISPNKELLSSLCIERPPVDDKKFVPVMITPFDSTSKINFDSLSDLTDFYLSSGAKGLFANCLSSEMYALDAEERLALARHVVKHVNGRVPVVASGSFGKTIEERAEFTKKMYDTGVNAVILITSHFAGKEENDETLISRMEKFFLLTGSIPVGTYECPSPYKRILSPEVFKYLLNTNRLIYHKDTTLDEEKVKEKLALAKNTKLELYDAHTPNAMYSLQAGAKGISAIAGNFYPEIFAWLCSNVNKPEKQEDVKWIQAELTNADPVISDNYPMSAKYFLQKRAVPVLPLCRTTTMPLNSSQKQKLDEIYTRLTGWHERLGLKMGDK